MKTCPDPDCSAPLEGLGTYCHRCGQYTDSERKAGMESSTGVRHRVGTDFTEGIITLPFPPSANAAWRSIARVGTKALKLAVQERSWSKVQKALGELKAFVTVTLSAPGRQFKEDAASWLNAQRIELLEGPVSVSAVVYFPNRRGDLDNRIKPTLDVLQGVAFKNDSQVERLEFTRRLSKDSPRCEVKVLSMEPALFTSDELDRGSDLPF